MPRRSTAARRSSRSTCWRRLGGSIASYLFFDTPAVGASGAIFGLFGLVFVSVFVHKPALARQARALTSQIGILIVVNLVIGFAPGTNIDYMAHIGGLIVGAWLGFVIPPRGAATLASFWQRPPGDDGEQRRSRNPALLATGGVVLLGIALFVALQMTPFWARLDVGSDARSATSSSGRSRSASARP